MSFHQYSTDGPANPKAGPERGRYLASPELALAVNTALAAEQPLLVTGDPGTGKTALAWSLAAELDLWDAEKERFAVETFQTRSDSLGRDLLYRFDHLSRLRDAQAQDERARNPGHYVRYEALGTAIRSGARKVVLVDEIDKAPRDFPNDLLGEFATMKFKVSESGEEFASQTKPIVVVTSNAERDLPGAFLRRCVFFHIPFPDHTLLVRILTERLGGEGGDDGLSAIAEPAVTAFEHLRESQDWKKKPATGELLKWTQVLLRSGVDPASLATPRWPELFPWALAKTREDLKRVMAAG